MGRKRLLIKRIDNPCSRQIAYSKRGKGILKKATELSTLCGADVALLMFSPTGRLTSYTHKGRVMNFFLFCKLSPRLQFLVILTGYCLWLQFLYESLKHLKYEAEILDKIERFDVPLYLSLSLQTCTFACLHTQADEFMITILVSLQALERKPCELNRKKYEAQEKMWSYSPDVSNIYLIAEAQHHQQFVTKAIQRIEKLKKTKLLEKETSPSL
ncbi:agamous-like MADS-box protein AGL104 [Gossypium hirsutum]|uniref:Agamous-like MADS-box protein AGL104 n=1 Tax=Gossypium hirsutum TaxID=3635 RepID=A0ABM2ZNR4_GOSHI|nr:agamous-like MADS-box protein AGL104 [Gossypium hirsutum]